MSELEKIALEKCCVGLHLNSECHKKTFFRKEGLRQFTELSDQSRETILLRTFISSIERICFHHEQFYLHQFAKAVPRICCDPFELHTSCPRKGTRAITLENARTLSRFKLIPGYKVCAECRTEIDDRAYEESDDDIVNIPQVSNDGSFSYNSQPDCSSRQSAANAATVVSSLFENIGTSPLKPYSLKLSVGQKKDYVKRKSETVAESVSKIINVALSVPTSATSSPVLKRKCIASSLVQNSMESAEESVPFLMNDTETKDFCISLKTKLETSDTLSRKLSLLTLVPPTWPRQKVSDFFQVSEYLVRKARNIRKEGGILPLLTSKKPPNVLKPHVVQAVLDFYESDVNSRQLPGKKDFVSVKIDGKREQKQKKLLLANISELYELFKKDNEDKPDFKIGRSKFAELKPPWCVTAGSSGVHSVCVCLYHQNAKLKSLGADIRISLEDLMSKVVCSIRNEMCMLHKCTVCVDKQNDLESFLWEELAESDSVTYKEWVHVDRTVLRQVEETIDVFIPNFVESIRNLTVHHFISVRQQNYIDQLKQNLCSNEVLLLLDFAENFSFLVQDAVQGFHWENSQATLHPFVVYWRRGDSLFSNSLCVISDHMDHNTAAVHAFLKVVLLHVKAMIPGLCKIYYFSDGAGSQYKNRKNFANLSCHFSDFGLDAEWNFFASCHGKNACDGIGGTVKRLAARASLQRPFDNQILTAHDLYEWADKSLPNITVFWVSSNNVNENFESCLEDRFEKAITIPGTQSFNSFRPKGKNNISACVLSDLGAILPREEFIVLRLDFENVLLTDLDSGDYVACVYGSDWWVGCVVSIDEESGEVEAKFMHPNGPCSSFRWPRPDDTCIVPAANLLQKLPIPESRSRSARNFVLEPDVVAVVTETFKTYKKKSRESNH